MFVADVDLACRVFAHQHHGKAGLDALLVFQLRHMGRHLRPHIGRKGLAVDHLGRHLILLQTAAAKAAR